MSDASRHAGSRESSGNRRIVRRIFIGGGVGMLLLIGGCLYRLYSLSQLDNQITISPETTVIDGPRTDDRLIDYPAALNDRLSKGVTPENNAVIPLIRAFGPDEISPEIRGRYFEELGIEPIPHAPEPVVTSWEFAHGLKPATDPQADDPSETFREHLEEAGTQPWGHEEFPHVADWLDANEKPLKLIVEASERPRYFSSLVLLEDDPFLAMALRPFAQRSRGAAELLTARAMRRLDEGQTAAAWEDILACHRLARHVAADGMILGQLIARAVDEMACRAGEALVVDGRLSEAQAQRCLADLDSLRPFRDMADVIDVDQRYATLDVLQNMARGRVQGGGGPDPLPRPMLNAALDWNLLLRMTNDHFDKVVRAWQHDGFARRRWALRDIADELDAARRKNRMSWWDLFDGLLGKRRKTSRRIGLVLLSLQNPASEQFHLAETRALARTRLTRIGFALAAYRAANGAYPETLQALAPQYLPAVPRDPFTDKPFRYELTADGTAFRVYSVGGNLTDDDGRGRNADSNADDILFGHEAARKPENGNPASGRPHP